MSGVKHTARDGFELIQFFKSIKWRKITRTETIFRFFDEINQKREVRVPLLFFIGSK